MKKILLFIITAFSFSLYAQTAFEIPKYDITKSEDCEQYNVCILECINWLENISPNIYEKEQKEAKTFFTAWLDKSPDISIVVDEKIAPFINSSPNMLTYFLSGWAKKSLATKKKLLKSDYAYAGLQNVMNYYTKYKGLLPPDKNIEKMIEKDKTGALFTQLQIDMINYDFRK